MNAPTTGERRPARRRDERGDTLSFLVLWPAMIMAVVVLAVHAFIVVNAQAEASLAASAGLRAAWRAAADSDLVAETDPGLGEAAKLGEGAANAVERIAGDEDGWRWWFGGVSATYSDWCSVSPLDRPAQGETGWVRVVVSGDVIGPMSWFLPGRLDKVYATAEGPALLSASLDARGPAAPGEPAVPAQWARADLPRC